MEKKLCVHAAFRPVLQLIGRTLCVRFFALSLLISGAALLPPAACIR